MFGEKRGEERGGGRGESYACGKCIILLSSDGDGEVSRGERGREGERGGGEALFISFGRSG